MGQHDRVDFSRVHRQRVPVAQAQLLEALEQAAIEQHLAAAGCQQVFGAGHGAGGAEELYVHGCSRLIPSSTCHASRRPALWSLIQINFPKIAQCKKVIGCGHRFVG
jgi:hypothetical protein